MIFKRLFNSHPFGWTAVWNDYAVSEYEGGKINTSDAVTTLPDTFYIGTRYGVDLKTGVFLIDGKGYQFGDENGCPLKPEKLIYFKRRKAEVNSEGEESLTTRYFIGYSHSQGNIALCIPEDGPVTICTGHTLKVNGFGHYC